MPSYQLILTAGTAASVTVLAVALPALIRMEWGPLYTLAIGFVTFLSILTAFTCQTLKSLEPCDSLSCRSFIIKALVKLLIATGGRYQLWKLREAYKSRSAMRKMQEATLMKIVKQSKDTIFGRDHHFSDIRGIEDYRARVPVRDYADLDMYNQLAYKGESNVYFKGPVNYLSKTSGTTGKNKTFPNSNSLKSSIFLGFMVSLRCYEEFLTKVGRRDKIAKELLLAVYPKDTKNEFGIPIGPMTKFFFTASENFTTPDEVYLKVHDSKIGHYVHAVFALWHEDISMINAFFPSGLITFMRSTSAEWESILRDIETGRLSADKVPLDKELVDLLNQRLSPKPERATQLRAIFGDGRDLSGFFEKAWPAAPSIILARSGSFQSSYRYLQKYLGDVPTYCPCIMGTEGFVGLNMSVVGVDEHDRYYPMLANSFFEFVPVDAYGKDLGEPKLAHELQVGCLYETVATSYNCFRLRVGDVIKVVEIDACAPVFELSHRKSHVLSVHVEKTTEKSLQACVMLATQRLTCQVVDFTAADCFLYEPVAGVSLGAKYYAMFVELDGDRRLTDEEKLTFDKALRESCENYNLFRGENQIATMQVIQVKQGAFVALRQHMMAINKDISEIQFKMPRVVKSDGQVKCLLEHKV